MNKKITFILIIVFLLSLIGFIFYQSFFSTSKMKKFEAKKVSLITNDGVTIVGNYFTNNEAKFAGILIHQRPLTKESFTELAEFLNKEGYAVLAIDLRGHGESKQSISGKLDYNKFTPDEERKSINDLEVASSFLEKEGYPKEKQFLIGASIGANLSFQFLSENKQIKAAILLSPGLDYRGIVLENFKKEGLGDKLLIVAALDDNQAVQAGRKLKEWYPSMLYLEYQSGGHGIDLIKNNPDLKEKIINWLREKLI